MYYGMLLIDSGVYKNKKYKLTAGIKRTHFKDIKFALLFDDRTRADPLCFVIIFSTGVPPIIKAFFWTGNWPQSLGVFTYTLKNMTPQTGGYVFHFLTVLITHETAQ